MSWFPPLPGDQPNEGPNIPIGQSEGETPCPDDEMDPAHLIDEAENGTL